MLPLFGGGGLPGGGTAGGEGGGACGGAIGTLARWANGALVAVRTAGAGITLLACCGAG